jgi:hypothetical protein
MKMLRRAFDRIVVSRGRDATSAAACITADYGDGWVEVDTEHHAYPRARPGLGDMVASGLSAVGITKERVSKLAGGDCGCQKRQAALNELGRRIGIG